jgi:hypothetical protein
MGGEVWEILPGTFLEKSAPMVILSTVESVGHIHSELHDSGK